MVSPAPLNPFHGLEHNAKSAPDVVFIATAKQTITFGEALKTIKQLAFELRRLGLQPGDLVAIDLPEVLSLMFMEATIHEAAASALFAPGYHPEDGLNIDWFVTNRADAKAPSGSRVILVDDHFLALVEQNPSGISPKEFRSADDLMWVMFSSGTTGTPKAIPIHISVASQEMPATPDPWIVRGNFLSFLPAKTPFGLWAFGLSTLMGIPFLALGDNVPRETIALVEKYGVRVFVMSPAQVAGFVSELEATGRTLPQIEAVYTIGTAMSPELNVRLRAATEGCEILNVYGSAEGGIVAIRDYESDDPSDVGKVKPESGLQVVDDDGIPLPIGEVGRIRHRTAMTATGYLGAPDSESANWDDGWFYPGDLGILRADGGLTLAGRASEIINAGGVKIDPIRIDQFATKHTGVLDAASFGYDTGDGIEQVGIALVTEDGLDVQALVAEFETTFGPAAPKLVARIDAIPRNIMGKPLRRVLADRYREN